MKESFMLSEYFLYQAADRFIRGAGVEIEALKHALELYDPKDKSKKTKDGIRTINEDVLRVKKEMKMYLKVYNKLDKKIKMEQFGFTEKDLK